MESVGCQQSATFNYNMNTPTMTKIVLITFPKLDLNQSLIRQL